MTSYGIKNNQSNAEDILQACCFQWAWNCRTETRRLMWHVPNGKKRTLVEAKQLQAMGVVAGVHDIHFFWKGGMYIIEMKVGNNRLSEAQEKYKECMTKHGAYFFECRNLERFKKIIDSIINNIIPLPSAYE